MFSSPYPLIDGDYHTPVADIGSASLTLFWEVFYMALQTKMDKWEAAQLRDTLDAEQAAAYKRLLVLLRLMGAKDKDGKPCDWEAILENLFNTGLACRQAREQHLIMHDLPIH